MSNLNSAKGEKEPKTDILLAKSYQRKSVTAYVMKLID